jgi:hypothetical protein
MIFATDGAGHKNKVHGLVHKSGAQFDCMIYDTLMLIGYARVSSQGQSLDRQIGALNTAKADKIFREVASGRTVKGRPQLERAIDALGAGDILVIAEWDRATRSMPKHDLASMEHPLFSLSTRPDKRILKYTHNDTFMTVTPSVKGRVTIFDADILIFCISQLMAALNTGRATTRTLTLTAHDLLVATGRDTSGDGYRRLCDAFERLAGTRITTNIVTGATETTFGFGLIEGWEIVRRTKGGRMVSVTVTLSDWLYRAVLSKSVLTLSREYFGLRKPLERRLYELARKHCGRQSVWRVSVATLCKKSGSNSPLCVFRAMLRESITAGRLPDYSMTEEPGDIIAVRPVSVVETVERVPQLSGDILDAPRRLAPGVVIYALEAAWRGMWIASGRTRLRNPDKAFLGWVAEQQAQG